jgi:hypothetical protein
MKAELILFSVKTVIVAITFLVVAIIIDEYNITWMESLFRIDGAIFLSQ